MRDRTLVGAGAIGAALAVVCCATPLLAIVLGSLGGVGLAAWLARADYVVIPALLVCLGLVGLVFYRRRNDATCLPPARRKDAAP
ncbi:MAG: mercury resistance system transport protein MerF [Methylocystis sp.]|nr:mercury resistance system transport protein MerF [Methylocystis sp.]